MPAPGGGGEGGLVGGRACAVPRGRLRVPRVLPGPASLTQGLYASRLGAPANMLSVGAGAGAAPPRVAVVRPRPVAPDGREGCGCDVSRRDSLGKFCVRDAEWAERRLESAMQRAVNHRARPAPFTFAKPFNFWQEYWEPDFACLHELWLGDTGEAWLLGLGVGRRASGVAGQGCIRSEGASEAVRQAVGGGCQSGWGRLLSVTNAIEAGAWRHGHSGWA